MKRRAFLTGLGASYAIGMLDWLRYFRRNGVPGTTKSLGIAEAAAQATGLPRFLVYWFQEGGWDGYSMFNPVATRNDALGGSSAAPADQIYRPRNVALVDNLYPVAQKGNIRYGHLAEAGTSLFDDMAVVSSHFGGQFHSGSRLQYLLGMYTMQLSSKRQADERAVLQAFCEHYGASYLMPHIAWHNWLSDGELAPANYPEGTGYYEKLGPAYAHTTYGNTPAVMRQRIAQIAASAGAGRDAEIHKFVDNLHSNFLKDKNGQSVKAFAAAVQVHKTLVSAGSNIDPNTLFSDPTLRGEFGIQAADETTSATSVNGNPARSKNSPKTNVQALMAYELMTKGLSIGFWIESRDIRGFDTHNSRAAVLRDKGQQNQKGRMDADLWTPLNALAKRLKSTQYAASGKSYWDLTTIVLASEMGRSLGGGDDDVCQHWNTSSVAFLGGNVKGGTQFGAVGTQSLDAIPTMPDGSLDPAYDPVTGVLKGGATKSASSFVSDAGHVYATALELAGIPKSMQTGKNARPPLSFVKKA
ncbi:MAG TPA: DUF1501 domain-containing protein [Labilithrix sp.]|nr:DUF1501 domain-containing protein [Labilithrix sp.]